MKDAKVKIKVRPTLYGRFAFKIYLPFLDSLGLYDLQINMLNDIKNNIGKYYKIKSVVVNEKGEESAI